MLSTAPTVSRQPGGSRSSQPVAHPATAWSVPVTAGLHPRFGGGNKTFRVEGPAATGIQIGDLKSGSRQMENESGNQGMST